MKLSFLNICICSHYGTLSVTDKLHWQKLHKQWLCNKIKEHSVKCSPIFTTFSDIKRHIVCRQHPMPVSHKWALYTAFSLLTPCTSLPSLTQKVSLSTNSGLVLSSDGDCIKQGHPCHLPVQRSIYKKKKKHSSYWTVIAKWYFVYEN